MKASVYNSYIKNLCLVTCVLCLLGSFAPKAVAYTYSKSVDEAVKSILKGDYEEALDICRSLERKTTKNSKGEVLYVKGICFMKLEDYEQAREVFKQALVYAQADLSTELYMSIADSYFMEQRYDQAISVYEQLIGKAKNNEDYLAGLYFKLGKSLQQESQWAKSKYYFDILERKFPQSFEAQLVKKLSVGGNFFTIQVGCFSNKQNAEKLQNDLSRKGYDVFVTPFKTNGEQLYRVRVGEFVTRLAAEHTERELSTQEHLPTHIFP